MALKSQSFTIRRGDNLSIVSSFLFSKIGYDIYLIKDISAISINNTVTQLNIVYQDTPDFIVDSYAPRPGAILNTGLSYSEFDYRILFNTPIDPNSIVNGTFVVDSSGLATNQVYVDPNSNNYLVKLDLSYTGFHSVDFHDVRIDSSKIKRQNSFPFEYSPIAGYVINSSSTFHLGDNLNPYFDRRRGDIKIESIRTNSSNIQSAIDEFFIQRSIDKERLIKSTSVSHGDGTIDIYVIYLYKIEPQILDGFPLNNAFVPESSINDSLTLVFNTRLDPEYLFNTSGLFSIESDFNTSVNINPNHISLLSDTRTLKINLVPYLGPEKIFSIVSRPGLKSQDGFSKVKPEQWVFHITALPSGSLFTGDINLTDYVRRDGTSSLTADWDAGGFTVSNLGTSMVQPTAPTSPAIGQVWLDTGTDTATNVVSSIIITGTYTPSIIDTIIYCSGNSAKILLPSASILYNKIIWIKNIHSTDAIITGQSNLIDDVYSFSLSQYESVTVTSNNTQWWII